MRSVPRRPHRARRFLFWLLVGLLIPSAVVVYFGPASSDEVKKVLLYNYEGLPLLIRKNKPIRYSFDVELFKGDRLDIDDDSTAEVTVHYFGGIRLSSGRDCRIITTEESHFCMVVDKGAFVVNLKNPPAGSMFTIETPHAIVVAHGTAQFNGTVEVGEGKAKGTHVALRKGVLDVTSKESTSGLRIQDGMAVDVMQGAFVPNVRNANPEEEAILRNVNRVPVLEPEKS